jgi:DMSO/TMAO reductase YedYZ molybdopterin-dependent catalytic subunit
MRPEQGYPMRLFLPGWEGNISIKWLRRLEVSDKPYYTREETSKYSDHITTTGKSRIFTFTMEAKSVITFLSGEMKLPGRVSTRSLDWPGAGAARSRASRYRPMAAGPGVSPHCSTQCWRSAKRASGSHGYGMGSLP